MTLYNSSYLGLVTGALLLTFPGATLAADSASPVEPIFTRYARTYTAPTLDIRVEYFRDKPMEELEDFDGYTALLDFTYPLSNTSQIELLLPLYTNGEGDYLKPGDINDGRSLDVEGYGGTRDFASLIYERQVRWVEEMLDVNFAVLAGAGYRLDTIDAELNGELVDKFNHKGHNFQVGLKADADSDSGAITMIGNVRYVMFRDTDDINLTGDDIDFEVLYVNSAILLNQFGRLTPALEMLLEHDFEDFTAFSLSPELIYTVTDKLDFKLGVPFSLTSDGQDAAAELEVTFRF